MFTNIKKHKDLYLISVLATIFTAFCSYYVVDYFIPMPFWVYLIGTVISVVLGIFVYFLINCNYTAKDLFRTIIEKDDKGLYVKLCQEVGITLGEYIYYKNRVKYHKVGQSRKQNDLRYLLNEFRLKAR